MRGVHLTSAEHPGYGLPHLQAYRLEKRKGHGHKEDQDPGRSGL